jgi:hypothetical protein
MRGGGVWVSGSILGARIGVSGGKGDLCDWATKYLGSECKG